jgi:hypothetical protein
LSNDSAGKNGGQLNDVGFGRLAGPVAEGNMRYFMRQHTRELSFIVRCGN